jgi:hypothetical protein
LTPPTLPEMAQHPVLHEFQCRDAGRYPNPGDAQFIIDAFDVSLSHMAAMGSGDQWGTELWSQKADFVHEIRGWVAAAAKSDRSTKVFICEVAVCDMEEGETADQNEGRGAFLRTDVDGRRFVMVGAAIVHDLWLPPYAAAYYEDRTLNHHLAACLENQDFMWLEILITDFRVGRFRKGAGVALIERITDDARRSGRKYVWVHCWAGNEGKLAR